jgi:beta-glucosidase
VKLARLPPELRFPKPFLWGASTAAYQIEGGNSGSDLWDWERRKGWERSGACANSWELWPRDVDCLRELGVNAYRFSVEWGRLFPKPGELDETALRRYERQLDALRAAGITPIICFHHFTNPAWIWSKHPLGWRDEAVVSAFLRFIETVVEAFKAKVDHWIVFNEPMVWLSQGYVSGYFPPGRRSILSLQMNPPDLRHAIRAAVGAHRLAFDLIRRLDKEDADGDGRPCLVGVAQNIAHLEPARDVEEDRRAALLWDQFFHWNFLDGLTSGRMDLDLDGEAETVVGRGSTLDFVGVNYYTRVFVRHAPFRGGLKSLPLYLEAEPFLGPLGPALWWLGGWKANLPRDDMGREIYPEGLGAVVRAVHARYKLPVLVTENGISDAANRLREVYLMGHLLELAKAAEAVPVLGYLYWSLIDNYEWGSFKPRFGLYSVDYGDAFRREATPGGRLYGEIIRAWKEGR